MVDRIFRLFENLVRMGITKQSACYDKTIINKHFENIQEITEIMNQQFKIKEKKHG